MNLNKRIDVFSELGEKIRKIADESAVGVFSKSEETLFKLIPESKNYNAWFTPDYVRFMLREIGNSLTRDSLEKWIEPCREGVERLFLPKKVAVVMAGNIPAVGFNDFLSVLITGNSILAKLSSDDNKLLPAIAQMLIDIEPSFGRNIDFTDGRIKNMDAVIATGSNNSARYFDYYFGKYPHIIRKNRNGIAVLDGKESAHELEQLANDVFLYFGLGCRNVSKIFIPKNYNFNHLLSIFEKRKEVNENNKYFNNYEYNKAIYLVNGVSHFDTGNLLLVNDDKLSSPVSVLYYSFYESKAALIYLLENKKEEIQCIVASERFLKDAVPFGKSQQPHLWDYADRVDVIDFLLSI